MVAMSSFKDHFSSHAAGYAAHRPTYPMALVDFLRGLIPAGSVALDCGCGTGQLSTLLGEAFAQVIATDASPQQVDKATRHPRVSYKVAPAEASGLPDASVDLITVAQAAHWFDLPVFYAEARRIARPGAVLALITYGVLHAEGEPDAALQHFYWQVVGPHWPPERRHVEEGYRNLDFPFEELPYPPIAIEVDWLADDLLGYIDTWSAVRAMEKTVGRDAIDAFAKDIRPLWGTERRRVRFPISMRLGRLA